MSMQSRAPLGRYFFASILASAVLLSVGLYAFDRAISYSLAYSVGFVVSGLVCIVHVRRYGLPSWRAGIPLYYLVMFFVLPLFQQISGIVDFLSIQSAPKAWMLGVAGLLVFSGTATYLEVQSRTAARRKPRWEERWPITQLTRLPAAMVLMFIGIGATLWSVNYGYYGLQIVDADRRTTLSGVVSSLTLFLDVASVIAWIKTVDSQAEDAGQRKWWVGFAILTTAVSLYFALYSNSKFALLRPFLVAILAYFAVRRRLSIPVVVALILAYALVVYPFITTFRMQYDQEGMSGKELFTQSVYHFTSLDWLYGRTAQRADFGDSEAFGSLGRSLFVTFSTIVDVVDSGSQLDGASFAAAISFLIPRALWPNKPEDTVGNMIGHFTGMILPGDTITNVSPTQMGELYMNFGFIGLIAGMIFWGYLAHVVDRIICRGTHGWMATLMFFWVLLQEAAIGQGLLSIVKALPIYILVAIVAAFVSGITTGARREAA